MKIKIQPNKPFRFFKQYVSIFIVNDKNNYWWTEKYKKWVIDSDEEFKDSPIKSTHCSCHSVRAFRNHLKNHIELPSGTILGLAGKYVNQIAYGKIK